MTKTLENLEIPSLNQIQKSTLQTAEKESEIISIWFEALQEVCLNMLALARTSYS
ncbi:hypothetical protein [Halpernia humi]|nr:hypothetical protein [Halpernia humi]